MSLVSQLFDNQPDALPYGEAGIDVSAARYIDELPTALIDPWPGNRDVDPDTVELLASDIEDEGVLQPVLVRPRAYGRYQLLAGHHRVAAVRRLAGREPSRREWESVRALVVDLGDEEAERAVTATNVFMTPSWKPSASRRAVEWMRLGAEAMRMREADPERWRGVRENEMIAMLARERGIEVSEATVKRDKRAAGGRRTDLPAEWADQVAAGSLTARQAAAFAAAEDGGVGDEWLARSGSASRPKARRRIADALLAREAGAGSARSARMRAELADEAADAALALAAAFGVEEDVMLLALREAAQACGIPWREGQRV